MLKETVNVLTPALLVTIILIDFPLIFLIFSADVGFARYKSDTVAQLYPNGEVIWFTPAVYSSPCKVKVKWFPFDVQVCELVFLSWAYTGFSIDISPEISSDASVVR